jgi:hypothetical protein
MLSLSVRRVSSLRFQASKFNLKLGVCTLQVRGVPRGFLYSYVPRHDEDEDDPIPTILLTITGSESVLDAPGLWTGYNFDFTAVNLPEDLYGEDHNMKPLQGHRGFSTLNT